MSSVNGTSSSSNNMIRITGMATGLDTDTLVKQMMTAENLRLDKLKQDRQYIQWRQDTFRDIIKDFRDLRSSYLLIDSPSDTNMIKSSSYTGSTITSGDSNLVTASALPGAVNGVSTIKVNQTAKSAQLDASRIVSNSVSIGSYSDWSSKKITFSVNGTTNSYDTAAIDISTVSTDADLVSKINDAINSNTNLNGKIKASLSGANVVFDVLTSDSVKITAETGGAAGKLTNLLNKELNPKTSTKLSDLDSAFLSKDFYIKQSGKVSSKITITKDDTIQGVIDKIKNAYAKNGDTNTALYSDLEVSFSDLTKSLLIKTRNTGSAQSIQITSDAAGNTPLSLSILGLNSNFKQGQDAIVEITPPGSSTATTVTKATNSFTIDNVNYNLIKDPNGTPYSTTLTTKADSQSSFDKIKAFIDKYNSLVQKISDKINEKKDYNYKPLTDAQKKDMKEDDIKAWEDKAKQGILKNDGDLQKILYDMRNAFMNSVESAGIKLNEIGIDTYGGLEAISKPGQLKIDETKLKAALETRGDQVMKIFIATPNTTITDTTKKYNNTGIFQRLEDIINDSAEKFDGNLLKKAGYVGTASEFTNTITKQLKDQDKAIDEMNRKLYDKQERYYQMFAKLESAMNQLNSQQSWLTQQLSG
ncbi:flagellar filament capping protein FliD [Clostridium sp. DJ247]|uniref:flagellar filament capping protein FliD n=1 Tax=Clostridium sp. DJ247 TaxID=2726188 RepID=UPI001629595F|nr:flagellar filament capping protein FliD [Clostridium sp. DJ247]MBC2582585.1 flagellar filament capping protein FliD [Clostridium sp. DJ247]